MNEALDYLAYNFAKAASFVLQRDSYLYWPYIVSSLAIALIAWRWLGAAGPGRRSWREFWGEYFGPELWWHRSARADYVLYFANALVVPALFAVLLVDDKQLAAWLGTALGFRESPSGVAQAGLAARAAYTIVFFIAYDFGRFVAHCLLHDVPVLWEFHKVHHSAEVLTPVTTYRAHPLDLLIMAWGPAMTTALAAIAFNAVSPGTVTAYSFLGWHVLAFAFNLVDNLRHSPVWLSYGPAIGRWLVSPAHHQLHHSTDPRHFGRNRGFELAVWDRLYGTLYLPGARPETLVLGLGDGSEARYQNIGAMYLTPFVGATRALGQLARRTLSRFSFR